MYTLRDRDVPWGVLCERRYEICTVTPAQLSGGHVGLCWRALRPPQSCVNSFISGSQTRNRAFQPRAISKYVTRNLFRNCIWGQEGPVVPRQSQWRHNNVVDLPLRILGSLTFSSNHCTHGNFYEVWQWDWDCQLQPQNGPTDFSRIWFKTICRSFVQTEHCCSEGSLIVIVVKNWPTALAHWIYHRICGTLNQPGSTQTWEIVKMVEIVSFHCGVEKKFRGPSSGRYSQSCQETNLFYGLAFSWQTSWPLSASTIWSKPNIKFCR